MRELDSVVFKSLGQNQVRHIDLVSQNLKQSDIAQLVGSLPSNSIITTCINLTNLPRNFPLTALVTVVGCSGFASALADQTFSLMSALAQFIGFTQRLTSLTLASLSLTSI